MLFERSVERPGCASGVPGSPNIATNQTVSLVWKRRAMASKLSAKGEGVQRGCGGSRNGTPILKGYHLDIVRVLQREFQQV